MPLLWSPNYSPGPDFVVPRPYIDYLACEWWNVTYISRVNPIVLEEHLFGGYRIVAEFQDWFYDWSSRTCQMNNLFKSFYALAPGGSVPISAGVVSVSFQDDSVYHVPELVIAPFPGDSIYRYNQFPSAPGGYYGSPYPTVNPP